MSDPRHIRTPFMDPLVLAIRDNVKTVTRRIINPQPTEPILWYPSADHKRGLAYDGEAHFRRGWARDFARCKPGDIMDVCEALVPIDYYGDPGRPLLVGYRADRATFSEECDDDGVVEMRPWDWKVRTLPARYCPSWAIRHHRRLISVRPERLSEVTDAEAVLEGIRYLGWPETREGFIEGFCKMHKLDSDRVWVERREWARGEGS